MLRYARKRSTVKSRHPSPTNLSREVRIIYDSSEFFVRGYITERKLLCSSDNNGVLTIYNYSVETKKAYVHCHIRNNYWHITEIDAITQLDDTIEQFIVECNAKIEHYSKLNTDNILRINQKPNFVDKDGTPIKTARKTASKYRVSSNRKLLDKLKTK